MDYYKIYTESYDENYIIEEKFIKDELIYYEGKRKNFIFALNEISKKLNNKNKDNQIIKNSSLNELYYLLLTTMSENSGNTLQLALEDEIFEKFKTYETTVLPANYSFELFTKDLANMLSIEEINRLFKNNRELFEMMYKQNDFKEFEIKEYNMLLENTPIFKKLRRVSYSTDHNLSPSTPTITEQNKLSQMSKNENLSEEMLSIKTKIETITDKEKALLYSLYIKDLYNKNGNLYTQLETARLLMLFGNIDGYSIFTSKYKNSEIYRIISEGIECKKIVDKKHFLSNLIKKTQDFKLKRTKELLNLYLNPYL